MLSVGNIDDEEVNGVIKLTEKAVPKWTALEGYLNLYNYSKALKSVPGCGRDDGIHFEPVCNYQVYKVSHIIVVVFFFFSFFFFFFFFLFFLFLFFLFCFVLFCFVLFCFFLSSSYFGLITRCLYFVLFLAGLYHTVGLQLAVAATCASN